MLRVRCRFLLLSISCCCLFFLAAFFFIATATTEIYTLSLHDALPIFAGERPAAALADDVARGGAAQRASGTAFPGGSRSEEHTSELQSLRHLVCRLLLEKKKKKKRILL